MGVGVPFGPPATGRMCGVPSPCDGSNYVLLLWNGSAPRKDRQKGKWGDITPKTVSHNHKRENRRDGGLWSTLLGLMTDLIRS